MPLTTLMIETILTPMIPAAVACKSCGAYPAEVRLKRETRVQNSAAEVETWESERWLSA